MGFKSPFKEGGMFEDASHKIFANAKILRTNMTAAEMALWLHLKKGVNGLKFRRQHPIGKYVADFYCHAGKLIVELDGTIHNNPEIRSIDKEREETLVAWGYKVIRFTNKDVFERIEFVLKVISDNLKESTIQKRS